jgi:hypothetical protein
MVFIDCACYHCHMTQSKLTFFFAYPLDKQLRALSEKNSQPYPTREEIQETINHWRKLWQETDEKFQLIELISQITERMPRRNLECFVFGSGLTAASTPFIFPTWNKNNERFSDERFIDTVLHELLHIFLITDNLPYWEAVSIKYIDENITCRNHILLYAILYEIYQKVFNKEPVDFNRNNLPAGYARAIEIVREAGHKEIIEEYKSFL